MMRVDRVAAGSIVLFTIAWSVVANDNDLRKDAFQRFGTLQPAPESKRNAPDVALGRALFWDTRISGNGKTACASCHLPEDGGADRRRFSLDARNKTTARNSQTVFNAMLQPSLRWTGDRKSGAHQAEKSLTGSIGFEKAQDSLPVLKRLGYRDAFAAAFPDDTDALTTSNYAKALQAYEATLVTPAPFDRFLNGEIDALTDQQKSGLRIFMTVGCADCHKGSLLGGDSLRKFGVVKDYWVATKSEKKDEGLAETTKADADRYKFRVPMLRNIAKTAPFFHDGSVADLQEAVQIMADVQLGGRLRDEQAAAIVSFMRSLSGEMPVNYSPPEKK